MEQDPTRMCELLVGLGDVDVVGVDDELSGPLVVHVRTRARRRLLCWGRGGSVYANASGYSPASTVPVGRRCR